LAWRFGEERLLLCGLASITAGLLAMPFAHGLPILAAAMTGLALGTGLTQPTISSLISRRAGQEEQGEVLGVSQSVSSLARVFGPFVAGFLFAGFGRNSPYFLAALSVAFTLLVALKLPRGPAARHVAETGPFGREGDPAR
jgi:MFS transporter, DHA1 family, tetracycline resistance protein